MRKRLGCYAQKLLSELLQLLGSCLPSALLSPVSCLLKFNTSETGEIENEKRRAMKYLDKNAALLRKTCRLGLRNGTFGSAIRPVLQGKTAHIAGRFGAKNAVFGRFSADIRVAFVAHFSRIFHNSRGLQDVTAARPFSRYLRAELPFSAKTRFSEAFALQKLT